jgi:hypothetical protein
MCVITRQYFSAFLVTFKHYYIFCNLLSLLPSLLPPLPTPPSHLLHFLSLLVDSLPMLMRCKDSTSTPSESSEKPSMWCQELSQRTLEATPPHQCTHYTAHTLLPALVSLVLSSLSFIFSLSVDRIGHIFCFLWNAFFTSYTPSFSDS